MIKVEINRADDRRTIIGYTVEGHAQFDHSGKDIVCAAVSAITIGTVNSLDALLQIKIKHRMEDGLLSVRLPAISDKRKQDDAQLLLASMLVILRSIESEYRTYLQINEMK